MNTKRFELRLPTELMRKINREARREKRSQAAFIRRVLERYIEDKEFAEATTTTQQKSNSEVQTVATESMIKNQELLKKLADT